MKKIRFPKLPLIVREEWFFAVSGGSALIFFLFKPFMEEELSHPVGLMFILAWLFAVVLGSVFRVVRHADHLAVRLGEPYGTLILTLAVTSIEVISITTMMLHGANNPTLVRDTLLAVVMIILNGMVGLSILLGGWRHREQQYNLQGANAYLTVIIPLAVLTLILPSYTVTTEGPTLSKTQETFLGIMAIGLYATFLAIQTGRHKGFFTLGEEEGHHDTPHGTKRSMATHTTLLITHMALVAYLAEHLAWPIDNLIEVMHAPAPLGGLLIAVLVATPEAISAVRAARRNLLQRSVNIFLGSVLATIGLTVPTMMIVSHVTGRKFVLGLEHADLVILPLTLAVSIVTFGSGKTNILQGLVHLLLFGMYLLLVFQG